ncbi:MAG TPA: SDR family NAD(P)-dependent oxidoreductase, partial [Polyangiaceae bacterium]
MSHDPFRLDGKVALVTGSATGIGAAVAVALAAAGADVVCHNKDDSAPATVEAVKRLGRRSCGLQADLADRSTHATLVQEAIGRFERVDILVNNAGLIRRAPAVDYSDEDWDLLL